MNHAMNHALNHTPELSLLRLGAGDLIDRAVRFYRKFFWTFILIAAQPVVIGTVISVGWTVLGRQIFSLSADKFSTDFRRRASRYFGLDNYTAKNADHRRDDRGTRQPREE